MTEDHDVSATKEMRRIDGAQTPRFRGRCSSGVTSFMHYATPDAARSAIRRTHIRNQEMNGDG